MALLQYKNGTVAGTGSAINIELGFTPSSVKLFNETDLSTLNWNDTMADAEGLKAVTAGTISMITSGGITPYAGSAASASKGFTIGTDANLNAASDVISWEAWGR